MNRSTLIGFCVTLLCWLGTSFTTAQPVPTLERIPGCHAAISNSDLFDPCLRLDVSQIEVCEGIYYPDTQLTLCN